MKDQFYDKNDGTWDVLKDGEFGLTIKVETWISALLAFMLRDGLRKDLMESMREMKWSFKERNPLLH